MFNIYKLFSSCREELHIVYASSDSEGKGQRPSTIISKIKKIFVKLKEESDLLKENIELISKETSFDSLLIYLRKKNEEGLNKELWNEVLKAYLKDENWATKVNLAIKAFDDTNMPEDIDEDNIKKLYGDTLKTSVSKLERYKNCPFSFHIQYGVKVKENEEFAIKAVDTGSFMHSVIEKFFDYIDEQNLDVKSISNDDISKIVEKVINELLIFNNYYLFRSTPKFISLTNRLRKLIIKCIINIVYQLKISSFSVARN